MNSKSHTNFAKSLEISKMTLIIKFLKTKFYFDSKVKIFFTNICTQNWEKKINEYKFRKFLALCKD